MNISAFLSRFFGRENEAEKSKAEAKKRLQLVLVNDRLDMSETMLENLREDLIEAIGKYMEIDTEALDVSIAREEGSIALVANIPVLNVKRQAD